MQTIIELTGLDEEKSCHCCQKIVKQLKIKN
jgi:hypothetical protein